MSPELGKLKDRIEKDKSLFERVGWTKFVQMKRSEDDFGELNNLQHHARRLLRQYKHRGAPVVVKSKPWTSLTLAEAVERGPHKSCVDHIDFLEEEFVDMLDKGQWVILPFSVVSKLKNLRVSPPGVVPQRGRRPRWICDYTWSNVNQDTVPIAPMHAMQFGYALDRILRQILLANPELGPVKLIKIDISDGFYRIGLRIEDIPKLGVIFPTRDGEEPLIALPLVLPMGWTNSPPIFSSATETAADLANFNLRNHNPTERHPLDLEASNVKLEPHPPAQIQQHPIKINEQRDPSLPSPTQSAAYVDVFVDDFIALCQGPEAEQQRVRSTLMHAIDTIFRPLSPDDDPARTEPISLKKLRQGDCTWDTIKLVLGWLLDTVALTISLPQHRIERLSEILASVPPTQKRISERKWHKVIGELRSMSLALPGARHLFSHMQVALAKKSKKRIALHKGVHQAIADFKWIASDISNRPTRIAEVVPLNPSLLGDHDASGQGAGGVWFPSNSCSTRHSDHQLSPILWRVAWPDTIKNLLITDSNPNGTISISDLELAGGFLQLEAAAQCFDIRERTVLSRTDNLAALFWQRKGSVTSTKSSAALLRLFGIHQRFHRYVPRHDYLPGKSNLMADDSSRLFYLNDANLLDHFNTTYPQAQSFKIWTPSPQILSVVTSALLRRTSRPESVLVVPPPPIHIGRSGSSTSLSYPSTPFCKPSRIKYPSFKSSAEEFVPAHYLPALVPSSLARLKSTYGPFLKRSSQWGTMIQG